MHNFRHFLNISNIIILDTNQVAIDFTYFELEDDMEACGMDSNSVHLTSEGIILYNTSQPISEFQFIIDGAAILGAAGGAAEEAYFLIIFI